jgi:hypothetical protein
MLTWLEPSSFYLRLAAIDEACVRYFCLHFVLHLIGRAAGCQDRFSGKHAMYAASSQFVVIGSACVCVYHLVLFFLLLKLVDLAMCSGAGLVPLRQSCWLLYYTSRRSL